MVFRNGHAVIQRFCAVLGQPDPAEEILRMRCLPVFQSAGCALGIVAEGDDTGRGALLPWTCESHSSSAMNGPSRLTAVGDSTIYNSVQLRAELRETEPPISEHRSDGELLLDLFASGDHKRLAGIRGMFAAAVWDGRVLSLISDPLGARTVFYARCDGFWAVSSSLRTLRRWPRLAVRLNVAAVRSFLSLAYLVGDQTLLDGVFKLLPGRIIELGLDGASRMWSYWEPNEGPWKRADPPEAYAFHLRRLIEESTAACLPSGEDVGVFLSGGVDSSLVAAIAAKLHNKPVRTYTVSFGASRPNELSFAHLVASKSGTWHRALTFSGHQVASHFAETVSLMDCPVGEGLTVPNLLLARAAAEDGLRVILNGEGGDPCFGGPKNIPMLLFELHRTDPHPPARARAYIRAHRHCYDDLERLLSPEIWDALRGAPPLETLLEPYLRTKRMRYYLNRLMWTNLRLKGPGYMLTKVEFLTSAAGIQGRYPLFDRTIVEYAFSIPPKYKLAGTAEKWILKRAVEDLLPETILTRAKSGMMMPLKSWLKSGPLEDLGRHFLLDRPGDRPCLFQPKIVESWLRQEGALSERYGQKIWLMATLEAWIRAYVDRPEFAPEEVSLRKPSRLTLYGRRLRSLVSHREP